MRRSKPTHMALFVVIVLSVAAVGHSIQGQFVWDDYDLLVRNPAAREVWRLGDFLAPQAYSTSSYRYGFRPLVYFSYALNWTLFGGDPSAFHAVNVALYALNGCLVFALLRRLGAAWAASFMGAAAFALMPYHADAAAYVHGRGELMVCLFVLLGILVFPAEARGHTKARCALALICFALALLAKEQAAVFPALLTAYLVVRARRGEGRSLAARTTSMWIAALVLIAIRLFVAGSEIGPRRDISTEWTARVAGVGKTLLYYGYVLGFPARLLVEPDLQDWGTVGIPTAWAVAAAALLACFILGGRRRIVAFGLVWTAIALSPATNVIPIPMRPLANQRLFLPSVGVAMCIAALAIRARPKVRAAALVCILVLWGSGSVRHTFVWRTERGLYYDAVRKSPRFPRPQFHLGLVYFDTGDLARARRAFRRALALAPDYDRPLNSLGLIAMAKGDLAAARCMFSAALERNPRNAKAHTNLAALDIQLGDLKKARKHAERALRFDPNSPEAHFNLGRIEELEGREARAMDEYRLAIKCWPEFARPYYALAMLHARKRDYFFAAKYYRRAAELDATLYQARTNLAEIYLCIGKTEEARRQLELAINAAPYEWRPRCMLGIVAEGEGRLAEAEQHYRLAVALAPRERVPRERLKRVLSRMKAKRSASP